VLEALAAVGQEWAEELAVLEETEELEDQGALEDQVELAVEELAQEAL